MTSLVPHHRLTLACAATAVVSWVVACSAITPGTRPVINAGRVYVYEDALSQGNHGFWTNQMPGPVDADEAPMIALDTVHGEAPLAGRDAVKVTVQFHPPNWCGLAVVTESDAWGRVPVPSALDLTGATRLVFHARGEHGDELIRVLVATIGDQPHGDAALRPATTDPKWIRLSKEWTAFEIPLDGVDLRRVINVFTFVTDKAHNPSGPMTFYFDEIFFEMKGSA
jgi:hypothetical protein